MKILSLKFLNLNSLYGEWAIDFTHPEYQSNGLFAITGPTGAGKSTIMDAICLALYGETPRLGKITAGGNEIMSRQTGECYAEVVFESQSGCFRCQWRQHRARKRPDGKLAEASHELSDAITGQLLESKKREVAAAIEARTGMDFARFTRSILLAQGSFAAFLKASPDERSPILEQITGTEIYSDLSIAVHERQKAEHLALDQINEHIQGVTVLSAEDFAQLENELQQLAQDEQTLVRNQLENTTCLTWRENLERLEQDLTTLAAEQEKLDQANQTAAPQRLQLAAEVRTLPLAGDHGSLVLLRSEQSKDQTSLAEWVQAEPLLVQATQTQKDAHLQAEQALKSAQTTHAAIQPILQQTRQLDWAIHSQVTALTKQVEQGRQLTEQLVQAQSERQQHQAAQVSTQTQLSALTAQIAQTAADEPLVTRIAGITAQFQLIQNTQADVTKRSHELAEFELRVRALAQTSVESAQYSQQLAAAIQPEQDHLEVLRQQLQTHLAGRAVADYRTQLADLQREARLVQRILDLESERKRLVDGQPCPLCGAMAHPYALGNVPELDEVDQKITQLTQFIVRADQLSQQINDQAERITHQQETFHIQAQQAQKATADWEKAQSLAEQLQRELASQQDHLRQQLAAGLTHITPFGITELPVAQLTTILSDLQTRSLERQKIINQHLALSGQLEKIAHQLELAAQRCQTLNQNHQQLEKEIATARHDLATQQQARRELFGDQNPETENERLQSLIEAAAGAEKTTREKAAAQAQLLANNHQAQANLTAQLTARQQRLMTWEQSWLQQLTAAGFATEADFLTCRLPAAEHTCLQQLIQDLDAQLADLATRTQDRIRQKTKLLAEAKTEDSLADLKAQQTHFDQQQKALQQKMGELQSKQTADQFAREKVQVFQDQLEKQQAECRKWDRLHLLIGSADGKKYRNFAQGLTFERMVYQANQQLAQMTDRYLLVRDVQEPLQLNVIDNYQAGEIRTTRNLSGGESFIVSLALALGLSKMASRKVRVDSLFLDEGFGTLDDDALETALETLASLQAENKLIGVISHVPALKERISTQLRIQAQSGGKSTISGPGVERLHKMA